MITVKNLKKSFGQHEVLKNINVSVKPQEVVVVIGPSGSGKSTFLRRINLLETITDGHVYIEGIDLADKKTDINEVRMEVGMVFQQFNLFPHKTVLENIKMAPLKVRKVSEEKARQKGLELLSKVGLEDKANAYPDSLSGGQKQRVPAGQNVPPRLMIQLWGTLPKSSYTAGVTSQVFRVTVSKDSK